jgi:hypothetical protein
MDLLGRNLRFINNVSVILLIYFVILVILFYFIFGRYLIFSYFIILVISHRLVRWIASQYQK